MSTPWKDPQNGGIHPDIERWVEQIYGPLADPCLDRTQLAEGPINNGLVPHSHQEPILHRGPEERAAPQANLSSGRRRRLSLGVVAAVAAGGALLASPVIQENANPSEQSSDGAASTPAPDFLTPKNVEGITVDFVQLQGSEGFSRQEQEAALANTATAVSVWQGISENFFPVTPKITSGGMRELDASIGVAADICEDAARHALQANVLDELNRRSPLGTEAMRIVVMDASATCSPDMAVSAEAYEEERVIFANTGVLEVRTTAHEIGHILLNFADAIGYDCSDRNLSKPFPKLVNIESCEVRSHFDRNTLMGSFGGNDYDPLSGAEMRRTGLIKPEQVARPNTEQSGGAEIVLDALPNPEHPGQTKLISVPLNKIASFETILKTHKDSLYIELSGSYPEDNQGLRINAYLIDESSISKESDNRGHAPDFYQVFLGHWGNGRNSEKAGQQIVIEGEAGRLTIDIAELTKGPNGQGQARLNISTESL